MRTGDANLMSIAADIEDGWISVGQPNHSGGLMLRQQHPPVTFTAIDHLDQWPDGDRATY